MDCESWFRERPYILKINGCLNILNELNDRQRDAVTSEAPSLLVLAGAGSGKPEY
ncbi:MAG: hypothetical protein CM15mP127_12190 [Gammaproteobacteria bacterium]|nr:MAG: hypothetical protein CM15mP127_12190 [Gammaproteobacteria bacterium]